MSFQNNPTYTCDICKKEVPADVVQREWPARNWFARRQLNPSITPATWQYTPLGDFCSIECLVVFASDLVARGSRP